MKGTSYIFAVIVIVCLIFWRKSIVNKRGKGQKSIDSSSKAKNYSKKEDLHTMSETRTKEETFFKKAPEVKEKEAYDGSRKKDRGKKRREKKKSNEIKSEVKTEEVEEEKKVSSNESKKETKIENQDIDVKVSHEADKIKEDAQASKENSEDLEKDFKKENQAKAEEVKENKKSEPEEIKTEKENLKITTEKYSDLISSLKNNPWKEEDLNTKVKLENTRTKKTISEEEIDNLPLEKIKTFLRPESIADFLNKTRTKPTILKRKEDTSYEFTTRDSKEIDLIKKRYGLIDREIDKITSVLIFDKEGQKLKEVRDILAEGKNRIYMETKF